MFNASERDLSDESEVGLMETERQLPCFMQGSFLPSRFSSILISLDFNSHRPFLLKAAVKFKRFSINMASIPWRNYCHEPEQTHRAADQGKHVKSMRGKSRTHQN